MIDTLVGMGRVILGTMLFGAVLGAFLGEAVGLVAALILAVQGRLPQ